MNANTPNRIPMKATLLSTAFWWFTLVYLETLLHSQVFTEFSLRYVFVIGFSFPIAAVIALLMSFLPRKANFPVSLLLTLVLIVLYGSEL